MAFSPYDYTSMQRQQDRFGNMFNQNYSMPQQYNAQTYLQQYAQQYTQPPMNGSMFDCKPVTSIDEAKAQSVRLDGVPTYLIDIGNKMIYEKKLNMNDGSAIFNVYALRENENVENENLDVINKNDLLEIKENMLLLTKKNDEILNNLQNLKMIGVDNNESNAVNDANARKSSNVSTKSNK